MRKTPLEEKIENFAAPVISDLGFDLVGVSITGEARSLTVQIMAENPKTRNLGVEDCTAISRALSAVMEVEDPINGAYRLEISSPGIDRMLTRPDDFQTYLGLDMKIELDKPDENGQKRFRGIVREKQGSVITVETDKGDVELSIDQIAKAKLVMSDALIKAMAPKQPVTEQPST